MCPAHPAMHHLGMVPLSALWQVGWGLQRTRAAWGPAARLGATNGSAVAHILLQGVASLLLPRGKPSRVPFCLWNRLFPQCLHPSCLCATSLSFIGKNNSVPDSIFNIYGLQL